MYVFIHGRIDGCALVYIYISVMFVALSHTYYTLPLNKEGALCTKEIVDG